MTASKIIDNLQKIKTLLNSFKKISKNYKTGHKYYKENLKYLKLNIHKLLLEIKIEPGRNTIYKEIDKLLLDFQAIDKPSSLDCSTLIDKIDYKIQEIGINLIDEVDIIERIYGKNSPFDFHIDLKNIMETAKEELFIVEPFVTEHLLEITLKDLSKSVKLKILTNVNNADKRGKFNKISSFFKSRQIKGYEVRESADIHDRSIFIDGINGWVMGQSIKDAGKKPTYLIKLQNSKKLEEIYESIWKISKKVN